MNHRSKRLLAILALASLSAAQAEPESKTPPIVGLAAYRLVSGPHVIEGVNDNASGIVVDEERDAIWLVLNGPTLLIELDKATFKPRRRITLVGFDDTEDLVQLAPNRFAVVEERKQNLVIFDLPDEADSVDIANASVHSIDPLGAADNLGLEGLTYDLTGARFYMVKEKSPAILHMATFDDSGALELAQPWNLDQNNFDMTDFSAVHFHGGTGHLLLLSDESKSVVETTVQGQKLSRLSLKEGKSGITVPPPQPEGVAMDADGRLYVCSEPNTLYVFEKP